MTAAGPVGVQLGDQAQAWRTLEMASEHARMVVWYAYWIGGPVDPAIISPRSIWR